MTEDEENDIADDIAAKLLDTATEVFKAKGVEPPEWDRLICLALVRFAGAGEQVTNRPWRKMIVNAILMDGLSRMRASRDRHDG